MTPARDQVWNQVSIDAWHIYRKEWVYRQVEILVDFQIAGKVVNQIDTNVKERVRNKIQ